MISSPSGGGKTTVINKILADEDESFVYSVSMTTRPRRKDEKEGIDYFFVDERTFLHKIEAGELIEYERVHDHYYGTPKSYVQKNLSEGRVVFLDIDVYGAFSIRKHFPDDSLLIFLQPPNLDILQERLLKRATEHQREVLKRLSRVPTELKLGKLFDATVINDDLAVTVFQVRELIFNRLATSNPEC